MKTIEQRIWDYLDGTCSEQERNEIEYLIGADPAFKSVYLDLKSFEQDISIQELEEPSMSFTRNVMDKVKLEPLPGTFKSLADKRIIYGIVAFFLLSIFALLGALLYQLDWSQPATETLQQYKLPEVNLSPYLNSTFLNMFLFVDTILGLYLLDNLLRKRMHS